MAVDARRWRTDALREGNARALTAPWYVTAAEMRALDAEIGSYRLGLKGTFYGMPIKVISDEPPVDPRN